MDSKKVILAEWDDNLRSLYSLNLSTYVNAEVVLAQSYKDIISKLKEAPGTALIITRAMQNGDKTAINLVEHLGPKNKIPILVIGVEPALEGRTDFLKPNCEIKDLIKKVAHHLGVTAEKMSSLLVPDYYPIDSNFFLHLSDTEFDIYIKIEKKGAPPQYVKRLHQGDTFTINEIRKYIDTGIKHLYVLATERLKFVSFFSKKLTMKLLSPDLPIEERYTATEDATTLVSQNIEEFGLREETIKVARAGIQSLTRVAKDSPGLGKLLKNLLKNQASYRYLHSQLVTFIGFHCVQAMEWGSKEQQEKIAFVSFFHDITLLTDDMAKIHTEDELEQADITINQRKKVVSHAQDAANLVRSYPDLPIGADTIIQQHHGTRNGRGFTKNLGSGISPLAMTFVVAEDFTKEIIMAQEKGHKIIKDEIIYKLEERYANSKYLKTVELLKELKI